MSTFTTVALSNVLEALYEGENYRDEVTSVISDQFLSYSIDFFKKVVIAKIDNEEITFDWYEEHFFDDEIYSKKEISYYAGLNMKTISNKYNTLRKEVVIDASKENYEELKLLISELIETEPELDITLTIKYNNASVELTLNETLVVVNSLAVKRAAIRGGAWSSIGKNIEKPLMTSLCTLYNVPVKNYNVVYKKVDYDKNDKIFSREIDFYLINKKNQELQCEVKLMGKGNPESADAVIARNTDIFIADKLSETNKRQLNSLDVKWIELRSEKGFRKFPEILKELNVPFKLGREALIDDVKNVINDKSIYQ